MQTMALAVAGSVGVSIFAVAMDHTSCGSRRPAPRGCASLEGTRRGHMVQVTAGWWGERATAKSRVAV